MNVYKECPQVSADRFSIRLLRQEDCEDLLRVYADPAAWPLFNADNCNGDDFRYTTMERMKQAVDFWIWSYENGWFIRFSIIDRRTERAVGTIELFRGEPADQPRGTAVLRLDLASDYETQDDIMDIAALFFPEALEWFGCQTMMTKIIPQAKARAAAFAALGFAPSQRKMTGDDGTEYGDYWEYPKIQA